MFLQSDSPPPPQVTPAMAPDLDDLEKAWLKASEVAAKNLNPVKAQEIARDLGKCRLAKVISRLHVHLILKSKIVKLQF